MSESTATTQQEAPTQPRSGCKAWVEEVAALTQPSAIHWCDGSAEEYDALCQRAGRGRHLREALRRQAPELLPRALGPRRRRARRGPHLHLLASSESDAGPTNNWRDPDEMRETLDGPVPRLDAGPHDVRRAVLDGPARLADRPHRRAAHRLRVRRGQHADHDPHGQGRARRARRRTATSFPACTRSATRSPTAARTCRGRATRTNKYIVHFPESARDLVVRLGLRRQRAARQEVLRAADRLGDGARRGLDGRAHADPQAHLAGGRRRSTSPGAFPSACGKTNLAMLIPTLPGWKVETIGDDIAWMKFGPDGRLYAINPEAGFFGVAPGTGEKTNPNAMATIRAVLDLHQLRADRRRRRLVGGHDQGAAGARDRLARRATGRPTPTTPAAHPNARFTTPAAQCPSIAPEWEDPAGVPIDAILFGGRRATVVPLVREAFDWEHGVFMGSIMSSETTAAAAGRRRASCATTRSRCCRSAATTWATTSSTGCEIGEQGGRGEAAEALPRELVPQGRRRQVPVARLRREQPRAGVDLPPLRGQGRGGRDAGRARARARAASTPTGLDVERGADWPSCCASTPTGCAQELPAIHEHFARFGDRLPDGAARAARRSWRSGSTKRWRRARGRMRSREAAARSSRRRASVVMRSGARETARRRGRCAGIAGAARRLERPDAVRRPVLRLHDRSSDAWRLDASSGSGSRAAGTRCRCLGDRDLLATVALWCSIAGIALPDRCARSDAWR